MCPEWLLSTHLASRHVQGSPSWRCTAPRRAGGESRAWAERGALAARAAAGVQDGAPAGKQPAAQTGCASEPELLPHRAPHPRALELGRLLFSPRWSLCAGLHGFTLWVMACTWVPCYTQAKGFIAPVGGQARLVGPQEEEKSWWLL